LELGKKKKRSGEPIRGDRGHQKIENRGLAVFFQENHLCSCRDSHGIKIDEERKRKQGRTDQYTKRWSSLKTFPTGGLVAGSVYAARKAKQFAASSWGFLEKHATSTQKWSASRKGGLPNFKLLREKGGAGIAILETCRNVKKSSTTGRHDFCSGKCKRGGGRKKCPAGTYERRILQ